MDEEILTTKEIEKFVKNFEETKLEDIGRKRWFNKTATILKLYQIAALEASLEIRERVKDAVLVHGKVESFIKELITLSIWKNKVLPALLNVKPIPEHSLPTYIILYNEITLIGLIQAFLFHEEMFTDIDDCCVDLVDYCVHNLITINADEVPIKSEINIKNTALDDINMHHKKINLIVSTNCSSILRYICEHLEHLPLNVASRIYSTHDLPVLIAQLIDTEVFTKKCDGKIFKFSEDGWREWFPKDPPLSKAEVQMWILIHHLILNRTCGNVYYFSDYRKEQLSKLLRHLHDMVLDQLSPLVDLKNWLHQNSIVSEYGPRINNPLIVEVSCQFKDKIYSEYKDRWQEIAYDRSKLLFYANKKEMQFLTSGFSDYLDNIEKMTDNLQSCMNCQAKAIKRCSKCKNAWYCARKCQVEHWPAHKQVCK